MLITVLAELGDFKAFLDGFLIFRGKIIHLFALLAFQFYKGVL